MADGATSDGAGEPAPPLFFEVNIMDQNPSEVRARHTPGPLVSQCKLSVFGGPREEGDANAALIAAAPDLLAACEYCLEMLQQRVPDSNGQEISLGMRLADMGGVYAERALAQAVAKAKGAS